MILIHDMWLLLLLWCPVCILVGLIHWSHLSLGTIGWLLLLLLPSGLILLVHDLLALLLMIPLVLLRHLSISTI